MKKIAFHLNKILVLTAIVNLLVVNFQPAAFTMKSGSNLFFLLCFSVLGFTSVLTLGTYFIIIYYTLRRNEDMLAMISLFSIVITHFLLFTGVIHSLHLFMYVQNIFSGLSISSFVLYLKVAYKKQIVVLGIILLISLLILVIGLRGKGKVHKNLLFLLKNIAMILFVLIVSSVFYLPHTATRLLDDKNYVDWESHIGLPHSLFKLSLYPRAFDQEFPMIETMLESFHDFRFYVTPHFSLFSDKYYSNRYFGVIIDNLIPKNDIRLTKIEIETSETYDFGDIPYVNIYAKSTDGGVCFYAHNAGGMAAYDLTFYIGQDESIHYSHIDFLERNETKPIVTIDFKEYQYLSEKNIYCYFLNSSNKTYAHLESDELRALPNIGADLQFKEYSRTFDYPVLGDDILFPHRSNEVLITVVEDAEGTIVIDEFQLERLYSSEDNSNLLQKDCKYTINIPLTTDASTQMYITTTLYFDNGSQIVIPKCFINNKSFVDDETLEK